MNTALILWVTIAVPGIIAGLHLSRRYSALWTFPIYLILIWWYDVATFIWPPFWIYQTWAIKQSLIEVARAALISEFVWRTLSERPARPLHERGLLLAPVSIALLCSGTYLVAAVHLVTAPAVGDTRVHAYLAGVLLPITAVTTLSTLILTLIHVLRAGIPLDLFRLRVVMGVGLYLTLFGAISQYTPEPTREYINAVAPVGFALVCLWWFFAAWVPPPMWAPAAGVVKDGYRTSAQSRGAFRDSRPRRTQPARKGNR